MTAPSWLWAESIGSTNWDYAKITYGSSSLSTDQFGNSYVTGSFNGPLTLPGNITLSSQFYPAVFVAKFDANGICLWAKHFAGDDPDTYGNQGESIDIDLRGNCYVTGTFHGSLGSTITLGSGVTLTGTGQREVFIVRYNRKGKARWAQQQSGAVANHYAKSITANYSGNNYTTGYLGTSGVTFGTTTLSGAGCYVVKYKRNGNFSWAKKIGDGGTDGMSITVGVGNYSYVTGYLQGTSTFTTSSGNVTLTSTGTRDVFLAKVNPSGLLLWVKQFGSSASDGSAYGRGITTDKYGNVYITGDFDKNITFGGTTLNTAGIFSANEAFVVKLDSNGNTIWAKQSTNTDGTQGNAILESPCGGCYVTGHFNGTSADLFGVPLPNNGSRRTFVVQLDTNGDPHWGQISGDPNAAPSPMGIGIDGSSYLYIAGNVQGPAEFGSYTLTAHGGYDAFIAKLDKSCL